MKTMSILNSQSRQGNIVSIETQSISKHFPSQGGVLPVLENISFDVKSGEVLAIVGKSGSGKSTLLNIISDLEEATTGQVNVRGSVGYVPQKDLLLPW